MDTTRAKQIERTTKRNSTSDIPCNWEGHETLRTRINIIRFYIFYISCFDNITMSSALNLEQNFPQRISFRSFVFRTESRVVSIGTKK